MAAFQFTARDPSVVPELRDEIFQKCTIKLDTNRSQGEADQIEQCRSWFSGF